MSNGSWLGARGGARGKSGAAAKEGALGLGLRNAVV